MAEGSKYPKQIAGPQREKLTLGIDANLEAAGKYTTRRGELKYTPPLEMHSPRSCFRWTIVDLTGAETKTPWGNIPAREVGTVVKKINAVIAYNTVTPKKNKGDLSLAYTVPILAGKFQKKTAATILVENEENLDKLLQTADFLKNNLTNSRYSAGNKKQIKAIEEAVELFRNGQLSSDVVSESSIEIYNRRNKVLKDHVINNTHFFCYSFLISFMPQLDYPWHIAIENSYVKIKESADGMHEAIPGTAIKACNSSIDLTEFEIGNIVDQMLSIKQNFESLYFPQQYKEAVRQFKELMAEVKKGKLKESA